MVEVQGRRRFGSWVTTSELDGPVSENVTSSPGVQFLKGPGGKIKFLCFLSSQ